MRQQFRVDIFSDLICPWCYIGWHRMKQAAALVEADLELDVHWLPFELNPDMPTGGKDRQAYLAAKFGAARAGEMNGRITVVAEREGLPIRFDAIKRSPSTLNAHRLVGWAEEVGGGIATRLVERLFDDYFVAGRDIGDAAILLDAAEAAGLSRSEAATLLGGETGVLAVRALEAEATRLGIHGVPFFILQRRLAVSGAQDVKVMADALREAASAGPSPSHSPPAI